MFKSRISKQHVWSAVLLHDQLEELKLAAIRERRLFPDPESVLSLAMAAFPPLPPALFFLCLPGVFGTPGVSLPRPESCTKPSAF